MSKKLTEVIIPEHKSEVTYLSDLTKEDAIVAYDGNNFLGFVLYDPLNLFWILQRDSCIGDEYQSGYDTISEMIKDLKTEYININLIVLNK